MSDDEKNDDEVVSVDFMFGNADDIIKGKNVLAFKLGDNVPGDAIGKLIQGVKDGLDHVFDKCIPPGGYWHSFKNAYQLNEMDPKTLSFMRHVFLSGMYAAWMVHNDIQDAEVENKLKPVMWAMYMQVLHDIVAKENRAMKEKKNQSDVPEGDASS